MCWPEAFGCVNGVMGSGFGTWGCGARGRGMNVLCVNVKLGFDCKVWW